VAAQHVGATLSSHAAVAQLVEHFTRNEAAARSGLTVGFVARGGVPCKPGLLCIVPLAAVGHEWPSEAACGREMRNGYGIATRSEIPSLSIARGRMQ
jgi:hypothetical protein